MNVFDELVEELKDEHLLEETVSGVSQATSNSAGQAVSTAKEPTRDELQWEAKATPHEPAGEQTGFAPAESMPEVADEAEYFRKRANDQVAGLQMVEHVITGIEREYMKVVPATFNDLKVKTALHRFLKITDEPDSPEHLEAEGLLIHETAEWFNALAARDGNISVANIRRFCENSRPILSSQALLALARFYRTSPGSIPVRAKFDFVMTRLFSRDAGDEKRRLLFGTLEMVEHIRGLYENWANLAPFDEPPAASGVAETLVKLRQMIDEADTAHSFDDLIASDYFNRTRLIKESAGDMLFVPELTAAAIQCNVTIGNRFVDLLKAEKVNFSVEALEEKYGYSYDSAVSGAASKTLLLADLVKHVDIQPAPNVPHEKVESVPRSTPRVSAPRARTNARVDRSPGLFSVNPWILVLAIVVIAASAGIYFWSENASQAQAPIVAVQVSLENSGLGEHIKSARSSSETFYGVVNPSWDTLSEQQQKDLLKKAQVFAATKGMRRVNFLNDKGRTVGYAAGDRLDLMKQ